MNVASNTYSKTQQKILDTALELISQNGFKATTTKQIARVAEINESTLFKNFSNKSKVFTAIQENESKTLKKQCSVILDHQFTTSKSFIEYASIAIYELLVEHSAFITITMRELNIETVNIGKDSIFEYITNTLSAHLGTINEIDSVKYNTAMFILVSSLMIMVVNQTNHHVLTDDLQAPIQIEEISNLTYQMIKTIK